MRRRLKLRLVLTYVGGLVLALLAFSIVAVFAIDRTLRYSLDSRLDSATRATLAIVDVRKGKPVVDAEDREQFLDLLGVELDGVVLDAGGHVLLSNVSRLSPALTGLSAAAKQFTVGRGDAEIRAQVAPIARGASTYGAVIVWRPSAWIRETDIRTAFAFAGAAAAIAIIAALVGNVVTQRALDDALERQRRFTADASHELRAPLAVITAEADLALARDERPATEYVVSLRAIQGEARRIEALVDDLLWTVRADQPAPRCMQVDLSEVVTQMGERLETITAGSGARFSLVAEGPVTAWVDGAAFARALLAVVHNAAKFARSRVDVHVSAGTHYADVAIADDGPGFSESGLLHATERFWREDRSRAAAGNGLGLSIARAIVEGCGGTLLTANQRDGGALVTFRLRK